MVLVSAKQRNGVSSNHVVERLDLCIALRTAGGLLAAILCDQHGDARQKDSETPQTVIGMKESGVRREHGDGELVRKGDWRERRRQIRQG